MALHPGDPSSPSATADAPDPRLNPDAMLFRLTRDVRFGEPGGDLDAYTKRWDLAAMHECPDGTTVALGWAQMRVFDIMATGWDKSTLCRIADEEGWDILDLFERDWMDRLPSIDDLDPNELLVLERVFVEKEFRGNGLGPLIGGMAIENVMSSDITHAVCFPSPFEEYPGKTKKQAVKSLNRTWKKLGFKLLADGVWGMDLRTRQFTDAFRKVVADAVERLPDVWDDDFADS